MSIAKTQSLKIILTDSNKKEYKRKAHKPHWYHPSPLKERRALTTDKHKEDLSGYTLDFRKVLPKLSTVMNPDDNKQMLDFNPLSRPLKAEEKKSLSLPNILNRSTSIAKLLEDGRKYLEQDTTFNTSRDFSSSKNRALSTNNVPPMKNYWNPRPLGRYSEAMAIRKYNKDIADQQRSQMSFNVRLDSEQLDLDLSQFARTKQRIIDPTFVSEADLAELKKMTFAPQEEYIDIPPLDNGKNNIYKIHAMQKPLSLSRLIQEVNIGKGMLTKENKFLSPIKGTHAM